MICNSVNKLNHYLNNQSKISFNFLYSLLVFWSPLLFVNDDDMYFILDGVPCWLKIRGVSKRDNKYEESRRTSNPFEVTLSHHFSDVTFRLFTTKTFTLECWDIEYPLISVNILALSFTLYFYSSGFKAGPTCMFSQKGLKIMLILITFFTEALISHPPVQRIIVVIL